jgi:hypothetical protein
VEKTNKLTTQSQIKIKTILEKPVNLTVVGRSKLTIKSQLLAFVA